MALIFQDTFTEASDTTLASHTPDTGTSWSLTFQAGSGLMGVRASTDTVIGTAGTLSAGALYTANATYPGADYFAQVTCTVLDSSDDFSVLAVRVQDSNNMYAVHFGTTDGGGGRMYKKVSGVWTPLADAATGLGITNGSIIYLQAVGNTISWGYGNRSAETHTEAQSVTDNDISAAGKAGLGIGAIIDSSADVSAQEYDSFIVNTVETESSSVSPSVSPSASVSPSSSVSPSVSPSASVSPSSSSSASVSPSSSVSPSPPEALYTREATETLPEDATDLSTVYTEQDLEDVETSDNTRVGVEGDGFLIHQFKELNDNNTDNVTATWEGRSTIAPSVGTVYLQIFNQDSGEWETLDFNDAAAADEEFILTGTQFENISDYYTESNIVSFRVYQDLP